MADLLLRELLDRNNDLVENKVLQKSVRDSLLENIAGEVWGILFPEGAHRLPKELVLQRWEAVKSLLVNYPNKEKIFRILESPASGERFHWLDSP